MKKFLPAGFFLVISLILILIWFRDGRIFAGGDVGFQTFNPGRVFENARFVWWDSTAPGSPIPQGLSAIPLQFSLFLLQSLGFTPLLLQATFFFVILTLMGFGMYLFLTEKLENQSKFYPVIGGIFYMFNPYMMIQVWHRFIHTTIVLAAVLPFLAIFWDKWIKDGNVKSIALFLVTNLFAVYIFGTYAYIITVWIFLTLITVSNLIPWQGKKFFLKIGIRFLFGFTVWILINCWWLIPVTKISPAVLSEQHKTQESLVTLVNISTQAILPYTLQLVNPFYPFYQAEFGAIYKNPLLQLLPWIFVGVILIGLINSFKTRQFALFGIFYIIAIFLAKGVAPPFGSLYIFGFKNSFALGVLRNPFEKTGLILVFFATVLFVLGIHKLRNKLVVTAIVASVLIFSWPMIAGKVFGKIDKPGSVEVPKNYKLVNDWLQNQKNSGVSDGNILHLPLTRGEAIEYKWKFGYSGLESSDQFFTAFPSISRGFNIHRIDDSLTALSLIFYKPYNANSNAIAKLLQAFNVRFIILHKDIEWLGTDLYNPHETEQVLNNLSFIEKKVEFDDLLVFEVSNKIFRPKIELGSSISLIYPQKAKMSVWPWLAGEEKNIISPVPGHNLNKDLKSYIKETLIFPESSFFYPEASESSMPAIVARLNNQVNNFVSSAQNLKKQGTLEDQTEEKLKEIALATNKLTEMLYMPSSLDQYSAAVDDIFAGLDNDSSLYVDLGKTAVNEIFKLHLVILSYMEEKLDNVAKEKILKPKEKIKQLLRSENLLPLFPYLNQTTEVGERQFFNYWLDDDDEYEILLLDSRVKDAYTDRLNQLDFQINGQVRSLTGNVIDNMLSFGKIDLKKGLNEISYTNPSSVNLISGFNSIIKIGDVKKIDDAILINAFVSSPAAIESSLGSVAGNDLYQLSFQVILQPDAQLYIQIVQDSDPAVNNFKAPKISFPLAKGQSNMEWLSFSLTLPSLSLMTRDANIRLVAVNTSSQGFTNTPASVLIKNLRVVRVLNNQIFLKKENNSNDRAGDNLGEEIKFTKINPGRYEGVVNLEKPMFIFFKETYHPDWKLQLIQGDQIIEPQLHELAYLYGNAWYINKAGKYKFKIIFKPQQAFITGLLLSSAGVVSVFIYLFIGKKLDEKL